MSEGPQRRPRLSADRIERAALSIVDRGGVEALSMRRLGAELGVEAMALYHYVAGKEAVLDRVAARVAGEVNLAIAPETPWPSALLALGDAFRAILRAHPRAVPVVATRPLDPEAGRRLVASVLDPLLKGGFSEDRAYLAIQSVAVYTIGHALAETGAGSDADDTPPGGRPSEAVTAYYDRWFALGLHAMVDGLTPDGGSTGRRQGRSGRRRTS